MADEGIKIDVSSAIAGLDKLDMRLRKTGVRKALRAGCKITLAAAKSMAPEGTGLLKRNLKIRATKSNRNYIQMAVGINRKWVNDLVLFIQFFAAFEMFGHRVGKRELGDSRKLVPANDFLTRAYEQTKESAVAAFTNSIKDFIEGNE